LAFHHYLPYRVDGEAIDQQLQVRQLDGMKEVQGPGFALMDW
jgi:hypothetical protein